MSDERNEQEDDMNCGLTIAERDSLQSRLAVLGETMPPRAVWYRIEAQAKAEGLVRRQGVPERVRWALGAGIAATVAMFALNLPDGQVPGPAATTTDARLPTVPAYDESAQTTQLDTINALMVRSQLLERDLRSLPSQPQVMRASTLATIDDLQDRIAAIDLQLNQPDARLSPEERELYWRERVRLMDSLVRLRYAQAQRGAF